MCVYTEYVDDDQHCPGNYSGHTEPHCRGDCTCVSLNFAETFTSLKLAWDWRGRWRCGGGGDCHCVLDRALVLDPSTLYLGHPMPIFSGWGQNVTQQGGPSAGRANDGGGFGRASSSHGRPHVRSSLCTSGEIPQPRYANAIVIVAARLSLSASGGQDKAWHGQV